MPALIPKRNVFQVQRPGREMDVADFQGIDQGADMIEQHFLLEGGVEYHGGHHAQDENKTRG
jgi:hypothetical protein